MITSCEAQLRELRIAFNFALDPMAAIDVASYKAQQWNYKWTGNYGSDAYHPETGKVGKQDVFIAGAKLSDNGKMLILQVPNLQPVNQLHVRLKLTDRIGEPFSEEVYWTIHAIPKQ